MSSPADSDAGDSIWETLMRVAVAKKGKKGKTITEQDRIKQIIYCLDQGVDIDGTLDDDGDTVLHIAVRKGYEKVVEFLRGRLARNDIRNEEGRTAITLAEELNNLRIAAILKKPIVEQGQRRLDDGEKPSTSFHNSGSDPGPITPSLKRKRVDTEKRRPDGYRAVGADLRGDPLLGDAESTIRSSRYDQRDSYAASGLKRSLHGTVYQLKHLMLIVHRVWKKNYSFCLSTEMDAAEKFDDLVLEYEESSGKEVHRFVQLKHKEDGGKTIGASQLLDAKDGDFSVLKYFVSWRKIKKHPNFCGTGSQNFILCTNVGLDLEGLRTVDINVNEVRDSDDFLRVTNRTVQPPRYKLLVRKSSQLWNTLKSASDVHRLASVLAKRVHESKEIDLKIGIFRDYHVALAKEVLDIGRKRFRKNFIMNSSLSAKAEEFRKIFFINTKQLSRRNTSEKDIWEDLEKRILKLSATFGQKFQVAPRPELTDVERFAEEIIRLMRNAQKDNVVRIDRQKHAIDPSPEKVFSNNIDKLAGHVLVMEAGGKIKFREQFLDDEDAQFSGNIGEFRTALKNKLASRFDELGDFGFEINQFKTCTEEQLSVRTELPDDDIEDEEISHFLDEFILAVQQPNEIELGEMIRSEIGAYSQFNLLNADFIKDSFQNEILDWFKKTGKYCGFLKKEDSKAFFDKMETKLSSIVTVGLNLPYPAELKKFGIRYKREINDLRKFLDTSKRTEVPILKLISSKQTVLTALRIYQTLEGMENYKMNDSFILIHLEKLLLPTITRQVLCAFRSPGSHDLLVVDCEVICEKKQGRNGYRLWDELCDIVKKNSHKRIILIIQGNDDSAVEFEIGNDTWYEEDDDVGIDNLDDRSREKVLRKMVVNFQGHAKRTSFWKLLDIPDADGGEAGSLTNLGRIIPPDTLIQLIKNEEIRIGSELNGLGDVEDYYIPRTIIRHVVIRERILKAPKLPDLFAIGGIGRDALRKLLARDTIHKIIEECSWTECHLEDVTDRENRLNEYVILEHGREEDQFVNLCEQHSDRNVHWLEGGTGKLIWIRSSGDIENLIEFQDESRADDESDEPGGCTGLTEELLVADDEQRIVILSDVAGMGKSTVFTHLEGMMKRNDPNSLVIRIDLTRHTNALAKQQGNRNFDRNDTAAAVDFLVEELLSLGTDSESETFRAIIKGRGKAALLFDGFDEISPIYEETVIELLKALAECQIRKLFVTTRPHTSKSLERTFGIFAHTLQPFSEFNQIDFLTKFWRKRSISKNLPDDGEIQELLESHARVVIKKLVGSINQQMKEFTGVPLQTRLVAEVFEYGKEEELPESIDIINLFQQFVDKKYEIFLSEKKPGDKTNLAERTMRKITRKIFFIRHQKLALDALFDEETVATLLASQPEVGRGCNSFWDKNEGEERTGIIIQVIDGKPEFIHRTFAEYFAAVFLTKTLKDDSQNQQLRKFFVSKFFLLPEHRTIRAFVNSILSREGNEPKIDPWEFDLRENHNEHRQTVYHVAAKERNVEIVRFFLKRLGTHRGTKCPNIGPETTEEVSSSSDRKADIHLGDDVGRTPLHIAIITEETLDLAKCLVKEGADVDCQAEDNYTPLHLAAHLKNFNAVKYLIESGADIHCRTNIGATPLHTAAFTADNLNVIEYLCEKGANIHSKAECGFTPLHAAARSGNLNGVQFLLEKGADIHSRTIVGETPLHWAASEAGNLEVFKYLEEKGADIHSHTDAGCAPLHMAARFGNLDIIGYLLDGGADIDKRNAEGWTPLQFAAARTDNLDTVKYLYEKGANIHSQSVKRFTALHGAAQFGNLGVVQYFCENGADINSQYEIGGSPLQFAVSKTGNLNVVKYLHEKGGKINAQDGIGATLMHLAAHSGKLDIVEYLVEKGVDINRRNKLGETPLHWAVQYGNFQIVQYFIEKGADIDCLTETEVTPLQSASYFGNFEIAVYLLEKGADIHSRNMEGGTPLHMATVKAGNLDLVKHLHVKGADVNSRTNDGRSPLHVAAQSQNLDIVQYLLENGADISSQNTHGWIPLHSAASCAANLEVVKYLHEKGADIHSRTIDGSSALHVATEYGNMDVVEYLVEKGANIDSPNEHGSTPMHSAASKTGSLNVVRFLYENGASIRSQTAEGHTPLHLAARSNTVDVVKYLVEKGADVHSQNGNGSSPLHTAVEFGKWDVVEFLVHNGSDVNLKNNFGQTPQSLATLKYGDSQPVQNSFGNSINIDS